MRTGKNMFDLRLSNRVAVLNLLYSKGGLSRKEIAAQLNLSPPAISHIVSDMIDEEVLIEVKKVEGSCRMGRREIIMEINSTKFKVLCVYIPTRDIRLTCIDLAGNVYYSKDKSYDAALSGVQIVNDVCDEILSYIESLDSEQRRCIIGIGLGVKGIYDNQQGISVKSFGLWEDNLPIKKIMQERLSIKVLANNDIRCIANAEMLFNHNKSLHSMLFLKFGPLVGGAFVLNGKLFEGYGYQAMELGHFVVDPLGMVCRCGKRGCLETIVGFDVITNHLQIQYSSSRMPILFELTNGDKSAITMKTIMESFDRGEHLVCQMLNGTLERLAFMLVDAVGFMDPQKVILYGVPFESEKFVLLLKDKINQISGGLFRTEVEKSSRNLQLNDLGCGSIVIRDFLNNGGVLAPSERQPGL